MALGLRRRNQERLRAVEQALFCIQEGSYGEFVRCGDDVAGARLDGRPEASLCVGCAGGGRRM
jgi:DnaK suppressor protein